MSWISKHKALVIIVLCSTLFSFYLTITNEKPPAAYKGETVKIIGGKNSDDVPIALTLEDEKEFYKILSNKDVNGYNQIIASGKIFRVLKGTKALVIDRTMNMSQVRILEGTHEGKSGWIAVESAEKL